jgi:GT2 family glycosyltransferase
MASGAEIVVVDNASSDTTVDEARSRRVRVIANPENRGFAAAVNQGFEALDSPNVLLLNPDAELVRGVDALEAACEPAGVAGAGGCLVEADGRPQIGFMVRRFPGAIALALESLLLNRLWPENPVNRRYRALDLNPVHEQEVEQPAGAFLMIRRDVWRKLGGFDEGFHPLWFEDVDFCKRAADAGFTFRYVPAAVAKHTGGHSVPRIPVEMRPYYWYRSLLRYTIKHLHPAQRVAVSLCVIAGSLPRMIHETVRARSLGPLAAYAKVVGLAGQTVFLPAAVRRRLC